MKLIKLNNKGFTLVEVLAVVIILAMLIAIMVPSVENLITKNRIDNYEDMKNSIIQAAKMYVSDNRYEIVVETSQCSATNDSAAVLSIFEKSLKLVDEDNDDNKIKEVSKLPIQWLVDAGELKTNKENNIVNPKNTSQVLDLENSYVRVQYQCSKKDYTYEIKDNDLVWE